MMQVYVAVCDMNGYFLLATRRGLNSWWDQKTAPLTSVLSEAWQYCLPAGIKRRSETNIAAGERIFADQTGHSLPKLRHYTRTFVRKGYVLVCFMLSSTDLFQDSINKGLAARPSNSAVPVNSEVVDWELAKVFAVQGLMLHRYLGVPNDPDDVKANVYARSEEVISRSIQRYKEIVDLLRTIN